MSYIFIIDKAKEVIFVTLEMKANFDYYKRPLPLDHKINIKWYLGYCTKNY